MKNSEEEHLYTSGTTGSKTKLSLWTSSAMSITGSPIICVDKTSRQTSLCVKMNIISSKNYSHSLQNQKIEHISYCSNNLLALSPICWWILLYVHTCLWTTHYGQCNKGVVWPILSQIPISRAMQFCFFQNILTKGRIGVSAYRFVVLEVSGMQKKRCVQEHSNVYFKRKHSNLKLLIWYHYIYTIKKRMSVPTKID